MTSRVRQSRVRSMSTFVSRLDESVAPVFESFPRFDLSDLAAVRQMRKEQLELAIAQRSPNEAVTHHDHFLRTTDGYLLRVKEYRPKLLANVLAPCLYWIHGGGYVMGFVETDDAAMENIAESLGFRVFSVDWRRAPEHPYPAASVDCHAGLSWVIEHAASLHVDTGRIVVGGASSGAGAAAGLTHLVRDRGDIDICYQLLIYPMLDDRRPTRSSPAASEPRVWNQAANEIAWKAYLGPTYGTNEVPAYAAPARATDLTGLPPAFIAVGDLDLFLEEDVEYAQKLMRAGVPTELHVYPGAVHGFDMFAPNSSLGRRFCRDRNDALRRAVSKVPG